MGEEHDDDVYEEGRCVWQYMLKVGGHFKRCIFVFFSENVQTGRVLFFVYVLRKEHKNTAFEMATNFQHDDDGELVKITFGPIKLI